MLWSFLKKKRFQRSCCVVGLYFYFIFFGVCLWISLYKNKFNGRGVCVISLPKIFRCGDLNLGNMTFIGYLFEVFGKLGREKKKIKSILFYFEQKQQVENPMLTSPPEALEINSFQELRTYIFERT